MKQEPIRVSTSFAARTKPAARTRGFVSRLLTLLPALILSVLVLGNSARAQGPCDSEWTRMDTGLNGTVYALTEMPNGDLIVGGYFTTIGGIQANGVARWDGIAWSSLGSVFDPGSTVYSLTTLPNGHLIAGGEIGWAGSANRTARWDGTTWSPVGSLLSAARAVTTLSNGELVAGGSFFSTPFYPPNLVGRWNGTMWVDMGSSLGSTHVNALLKMPNGHLVAAGYFGFYLPGQIWTSHVARWNGTAWIGMGVGVGGLEARALTRLPNDDVVVGGDFIGAGGIPASHIARWDGAAWSPLGTGMNGGVFALTTLSNGDVIAGGGFTTAGDVAVNRIARWNGSVWSPLGSGIDLPVKALIKLSNGDVIAGGGDGGPFIPNIGRLVRWRAGPTLAVTQHPAAVTSCPSDPADFSVAATGTGTLTYRWQWQQSGSSAWTNLAEGANANSGGVTRFAATGTTTASLSLARAAGPQGALNVVAAVRCVVSNACLTATSDPATLTVVCCDSQWVPGFGVPGMDSAVYALTTLPNGDLIAGGSFTTAGGIAASRIARWNGTAWSPLAWEINDEVLALAALPNGDVIAGGRFTTVNGSQVNHIARWNDTNGWRPLGSGFYGSVYALTTLPNGDVIAGGQYSVSRWNGSDWSFMGLVMHGQNLSAVSVLKTLANGDVIAGGSFTTIAGVTANGIASWNGAVWSNLGSGMAGGPQFPDFHVSALTTLSNGDLIAGGTFRSAGGVPVKDVARWNGSLWSDLGSWSSDPYSSVLDLITLPNDDVVAAGRSWQGNIARWNGFIWSPFGLGIGDAPGVLATLPSGDLIAGGYFTRAGGVEANRIARYTFGGTAPVVTQHPASVTFCPSAPAMFSVAALGTGTLSYQWQWQQRGSSAWTNLAEGPNADSAGVTRFTATGTAASSVSLSRASGLQGSLNVIAAVRVIVTNPDVCGQGSVTSNAATLTICVADFDNGSGAGTCDGGVGIEDLLYYLFVYDAGTSRADVDDGTGTGTPDGGVGIEDLLYYLARYDAGC